MRLRGFGAGRIQHGQRESKDAVPPTGVSL